MNEFLKYVDFIDNYQTSFDLTKKSFHINDLVQYKNKRFRRMTIQKDEGKIVNIIQENEVNEKIGFFTLSEFNKLDKKCKKIVRDAEENAQLQHILGIDLIEGQNEFPQKIDIGIEYLQKSRSEGYIESMIYLSKMFIEGIFVPQNIEKATEIIKEIPDKKHPEYYLLLGKIEEKNLNYYKAKIYYKKAIKSQNNEAMFCYGKLLNNGKGVIKNVKKAKKYFELAQENGYSCSELQIITEEENKKANDSNKIEEEFHFLSSSSSDDDDCNENDNKLSKVSNLNDRIKIVIVGDAGRYKIELMYYLLNDKYLSEYVCLISNSFRFEDYHGKRFNIEYFDTSGEEDMEAIRSSIYDMSDIIVFAFLLTNKISFQNIFTRWIPDIKKKIQENIIYIFWLVLDLKFG